MRKWARKRMHNKGETNGERGCAEKSETRKVEKTKENNMEEQTGSSLRASPPHSFARLTSPAVIRSEKLALTFPPNLRRCTEFMN